MKKIIASVLLGVLASSGVFAQKVAIQNAFNALKNGELVEARTEIESATKDEVTKNMPKTWVYRAMIYMAITMDTTHMVKDVNPLESMNIAQQSYVQASLVDAKKDYEDEIRKGLASLAFLKFNAGVKPYETKMYQVAYVLFRDVVTTHFFLKSKYNYEFQPDTIVVPPTAYSALQSGQFDSAKVLYNYLFSIGYKKVNIYQGLEQVNLGLKDTATALKYISEGRAAYPEDLSLMYDELNIYLSQNKTDEVLTKLKEAVAKNPNSSELTYVLGNKYDMALHDTANAVKYYSAAIKLKPEYKEAYFSMGVMFFNLAVDVTQQMKKVPINDQKKYDELNALNNRYLDRAQPFLEKAYELDAKDRDTLRGLKQLYTYKNMMDKAAKMDQELKALDN